MKKTLGAYPVQALGRHHGHPSNHKPSKDPGQQWAKENWNWVPQSVG